MENTCVITRKFTLIPAESEKKEWNAKIYKYTIENLENKIEVYEKMLTKIKRDKELSKEEKEKRIDKYINLQANTKDDLENVKTNKEFTHKMIEDYTKALIKDAMGSEARRKNTILSYMYSTMIENDVHHMEFKEQMKFINEKIKPAYRVKGSNKGSIFDNFEIENPLKGYGNVFSQELTKKIKDSVKNGLFEGKVSLPTYKLDSPFSIASDHFSFTYDYDSYEELCKNIKDDKCKIYFNYGGHGEPTIARFYIELKGKNNEEELRSTLLKVLSGEYKCCGSSIQMTKKKSKIILNLSIEIPQKEYELDENIIVGVDLGQAIAAACELNNNSYKRKYAGSKYMLLHVKTQLQEETKRLQRDLATTAGGHGRKKKLKPLDRFSKRERNFTKNFNHKISQIIIEFCLKNGAGCIHLECLKGYDTSKKILRNWSYYELQQMIIYKAQKCGIKVVKVIPCYTSQVCSECGHWEEGQRIDQAHFKCKSCGAELNADFNAARNIAKSTLICDTEIKGKQFQEARDYYGIVIDDGEEKKSKKSRKKKEK